MVKSWIKNSNSFVILNPCIFRWIFKLKQQTKNKQIKSFFLNTSYWNRNGKTENECFFSPHLPILKTNGIWNNRITATGASPLRSRARELQHFDRLQTLLLSCGEDNSIFLSNLNVVRPIGRTIIRSDNYPIFSYIFLLCTKSEGEKYNN